MNDQNNLKKYRNLCVKAISGNIDENEKALLKLWLDTSEQNKDEFDKIKKIWDNSLIYGNVDALGLEEDWRKLEEEIRRSSASSGREKRLNLEWKPILAFSTAVIIIAGIFLFRNDIGLTPIKIIEVTAGRQQKQIRLSDGSDVILNYGSSLKYPESFKGDKHEVILSGEAFFSVKKSEHPFIVKTENAMTTVLGTKFDVWSRNAQTRVYVEKGIVKVSAQKENNGSVRLTKNQLSIVTGDLTPTKPKEVNAEFLKGWTDGNLVFENTHLKEISEELARYYNTPVTLKNDSLNVNTLTGSFKKMSVDSVLSMICLALDLKYSKQNGGYLIEAK